jgi:5'/3'-nucleotidase SurE
VSVCIPDSQKSWISKAFHINDKVHASYLHDDKTVSRRRKSDDDWIMLSGTPATCTNIALYHLFPDIDFDLVIAGPNFGRNSGSAFTLASGTIGAALDAALSRKKAIALSFAFYDNQFASEQIANACSIAAKVVNHLWQHPWDPSISIYNVNVPVVDTRNVPIHLTNVYNNHYGSLFRRIPPATIDTIEKGEEVRSSLEPEHGECFHFSPSYSAIMNHVGLPDGSDSWAIQNRFVSITPLRASYGVVERVDLQLEALL